MLLIVGALALAAPQAASPVSVTVSSTGDRCAYRIAGRQLSLEEARGEVRRAVAAGRDVEIVAGPRTGYRCISAAATLRDTAVANREPGIARIEVPAGPCRVLLDGEEIAPGAYAECIRHWKYSQPEIRFEADPETRLECIEQAVDPLVKAKLTKVGFVGNEEAPE